jgi:hypothetical protein
VQIFLPETATCRTVAKPENVTKLSNITFLRFISSAFSNKDHNREILGLGAVLERNRET